MGNALWEYLWLISKVTKEENEIGYVLGGRPLQIEEIAKELNKSWHTVQRNLKTLEKHKYIKITKVPYGILITINKSKKFKKSYAKNGTTERDMPNMEQPDMPNMATDMPLLDIRPAKTAITNKDIKDIKDINKILSELLYEKILEHNPEHKKPDLSNWSKHIDLMIRIDKRNPDKIREVIEWCQADDFWYKNILSTEKLRKQYDQLIIKMQADTNKQSTRGSIYEQI